MTANIQNPTKTESTAESINAEALRQEIEAVVRAEHGDPFGILGMHTDGSDGAVTVRTFIPEARKITLIDAGTNEPVAELEKVHSDGFWSVTMNDRKTMFRYRFRIDFATHTGEFSDAYSFPPVLVQLDVHLLSEGTHLRSFRSEEHTSELQSH